MSARMTFSEGLRASNLCPSHRVIRVHADSGMISSMRGGSQPNAACSASTEDDPWEGVLPSHGRVFGSDQGGSL